MQNLRGLDHFAVGGKHVRVGQALADELQIDQPIIDLAETWAGKFDQIDLHSSGREIFLERRNQLFRLGIVKRSVKQVHSDHAEGFLLIGVRFIEHAHVNDDLTWFAARLGLKTNAQPTVRFIVLLEASGGYGVGENEKSAIAAELGIKAFHQQIVFVIEHRPETLAADVAIGRSVDRVAKGHVVGRHCLSDGAGGTANGEKAARHFLTSPDLGECPYFFAYRLVLSAFWFVPVFLSVFKQIQYRRFLTTANIATAAGFGGNSAD